MKLIVIPVLYLFQDSITVECHVGLLNIHFEDEKHSNFNCYMSLTVKKLSMPIFENTYFYYHPQTLNSLPNCSGGSGAREVAWRPRTLRGSS